VGSSYLIVIGDPRATGGKVISMWHPLFIWMEDIANEIIIPGRMKSASPPAPIGDLMPDAMEQIVPGAAWLHRLERCH
jgi:hypothetical protein